MTKTTSYYSLLFSLFFLSLAGCREAKRPPEQVIVETPEELGKKIPDIIRTALDFAAANNGKINDTSSLVYSGLVRDVYEKIGFNPVWSQQETWLPAGDSMFRFIEQAKLYGLFPEDYHFTQLEKIRSSILEDTARKLARRDAVVWSDADLLLTDAFMHLIKDIKLGRLPQDSVTMRKDSILPDEFYLQQWDSFQLQHSLTSLFSKLEPTHEGYNLLKQAIPQFLETADNRVLTKVPSKKDPGYPPALRQRLIEGGYLVTDSAVIIDSVAVSEAVKRYQKEKGITVDGKAGDGTIRELNTTDHDRFIRIAITMDRYKMLPEKMPDRYIWVNLPGYYMQLKEGDSTTIVSKIICGKPITRTPLLTSSISNLVTYPQWTIPNSIIVKEILPALKKSTGYLAEKGYSLIDSKGDEINPDSVDWSKYNKGIPYNVVQGSGDENALGILKFNFHNKYAVYLHDTNQRYLFARAIRSLSHGCVRVQEWEKLAYNIIRFDNKEKYLDESSPVEDSLSAWLQKKEKHFIGVRKRLPVFIRYFTCEGKDGKVIFFEDIYGEDKYLQTRYFAGK